VQAAGSALARCGWLYAETYCGGYKGYGGARNDFESDWLPHMTSLGFVPVQLSNFFKCPVGYVGETNVFWRNTRVWMEDVPNDARCPKCFH